MDIKSIPFVIPILLLLLHTTQASIQSNNPPATSAPNPQCTTTNYRGTCISCTAGYFLHLGYCYLVNPNCLTYNMNTGTCTSCVNSATLEAGLCIAISSTCADNSTAPCTNCPDGYVIVSGSCVQINSFNFLCTDFTNSTCTKCMEGYYLFKGGCTYANPLCATYFMNNGSCISCFSKYVLVDGICVTQVSLNPYCSITNGLICTKCNNGYFLNDNEICVLANPLCASYGPNGECLTCSQGTLNSPLCLVTTVCPTPGSSTCTTCPPGSIPWNSGCVTLASLYPFCSAFKGTKCQRCKTGTYLFDDTCLVANPFCATFSPTGRCTSCNPGNLFQSPLCLVTSSTCGSVGSNNQCLTCKPQYQLFGSYCVSITSLNPYCSSFNDTSCVSCSLGYYLHNDGTCDPANTLCFTYDMNTGACLSCFSGLTLWGSTCVNLTSLNPFCSNFQSITCNLCKSGYVMVNGFCAFGNPNCSSYDNTGGCLSCLNGNLTGPLCIVLLKSTIKATHALASAFTLNTPTNACPSGYSVWGSGCGTTSSIYPYCSSFIPQTSTCIACQTGYYLNSNGVCVLANPYCATIDSDGYCLSCNQGFTMSGTTCIVQGICKTSNTTTNECTNCNPGFVLSDGICVAQATNNPFCLTFSGQLCINCVLGYLLQNDTCILPTQTCEQTDNITEQCLSCSYQYFLVNNICLPVNPLCYTYLSNGTCTSCFPGSIFLNSTCVSLKQINPLCLNFNGSRCILCQNGYYLGSSSLCAAVSSLCRQYNMTNGNCLSCVEGYIPGSGICLPLNIVNPNCLTFNSTRCVICKPGYFLGIKTICAPVRSVCVTYSMTSGRCFSCGPGYFLQIKHGVCLTFASTNPNCLIFSFDKCINCTQGYYLGGSSICTPVNPLCASYNMSNGLCLTCSPGFLLQSGVCLSLRAINPHCLTFSLTRCIVCKTGYYVGVKSICMPVNPLCKTYSMTTGTCFSCFTGFHIQGNRCV